jgi:hypothetical protein
MLQNVDAYNEEFQNVKFSKHKRHITYSVTKCIPLQTVKCTFYVSVTKRMYVL